MEPRVQGCGEVATLQQDVAIVDQEYKNGQWVDTGSRVATSVRPAPPGACQAAGSGPAPVKSAAAAASAKGPSKFVAWVDRSLAKLGYTEGKLHDRIEEFQRSMGLKPTRVMDIATVRALRQDLAFLAAGYIP
jgi:hypothetical protein